MNFHCRTSSAIAALSVLLALAGCSGNKDSGEFRTCMDFLYKYMSSEDDLLHTRDFWEANVRKTLEVKERMGWDISDHEFMYFVLPLRAFNEQIDDFRTTYADTLCRRVEGMGIGDAALEINHWCRQHAGYDGSVRPGDSPMETVRLGSGTCTELSGFLVCALRAAGIPARQVNVVWAHSHGAHSWVEVWADGSWHYMGGAEPSLKLDFSWFTESATRVMMANITVFGDYDGPETIVEKTANSTVISNLARYAPEKDLSILVRNRDGKPVSGASLWLLVGKGEKKMVFHSGRSGSDGKLRLRTGYGDCTVIASSGDSWGVIKAGAQDTDVDLVMQMSQKEAYAASKSMVLVPPVPSIVPGTPDDWDDWKDEEAARVALDDSLRVAARKCGR